MPSDVANAKSVAPETDRVFVNASPLEALRDLQSWLLAHWLSISLSLATGLLLYSVFAWARRRARRVWERRGSPNDAAGLLARALSRTWHLFMALAAARIVIGYANPPEALFDLVRLLFTLASVFQVTVWLREIVLGLLERQSDPGTGNNTLNNAFGVIRLLVTVAMFTVAIIVALDNIGVNVTGLVAGLGIGGIAIGLAAQGIFADLFAALAIIFDKPFRIGDTIIYDNTTATVEHIGLKSTRLRALTGEQKIIANTQLLGTEITNLAELPFRRVHYKIGLIYQTSPEVARRVPELTRAIVEAEKGEFVRCGFVGFGDSSLDYELWVDIRPASWDHVFEARHRIGLAILERFNAEGIEFAYPTQTTFTAAPDGEMVLPYPSQGIMLKPE